MRDNPSREVSFVYDLRKIYNEIVLQLHTAHYTKMKQETSLIFFMGIIRFNKELTSTSLTGCHGVVDQTAFLLHGSNSQVLLFTGLYRKWQALFGKILPLSI